MVLRRRHLREQRTIRESAVHGSFFDQLRLRHIHREFNSPCGQRNSRRNRTPG